MKRTLYITDLDGTLLNDSAALSRESVALLRPLLCEGLLLTTATARSPATAVDLLRPLGLTLPAVLMTGAMLYDLQAACTLATRSMSQDALRAICTILEGTAGLSGQQSQEALAYAVRGGKLYVFYKQFCNVTERHFVASRLHTPYKTFIHCQSYTEVLQRADTESLMFLLCLETREEAKVWAARFSVIEGVACHFYPYEYAPGYLLEAYPAGCNKASGLAQVRAAVHADRTVCFGDNINDLPLFAVCDESCAVANADDAVKQAATHIIGANTANGVAEWIAADYRGH